MNGPSPQNADDLAAGAFSLGVSSTLSHGFLNGTPIVIKHALSKLNVAADWRADPSRSAVEAKALRTAAALIGQAAVPRVIWEDRERHCFAMERVHPRFRNWKQDLMIGRTNRASARRAGELLGLLHRRSSADAEIPREFSDRSHFYDLRIKPYFERVAERNPGISDLVLKCAGDLMTTQLALVHGDFSPKNILADGGEAVILDWEVAHFGDPRFDVAFCLCHLILKGLRGRQTAIEGGPAARREEFSRLAFAYLSGYESSGLPMRDERSVAVLACLMLARLEGDSPIDYISCIDTFSVKAMAIELLNGACGAKNLRDAAAFAFQAGDAT